MRPVTPAALAAEAAQAALLDVREAAAFQAGHLAGSGHLPQAQFEDRRAELPPRDAPLLVLAADPASAEGAAAELEAMGYTRVAWLDESLAALAGGLPDTGPPVRLWRPAPFLESVLPALLEAHAGRAGHPRALDLAAGSGREAVFLAMHGFEVEAWDHAPEALERARALAARHDVAIRTVVADLERQTPALPVAAFDVVTCFRFLHRPLFGAIERALAPGGHLVYETYRLGQERFGRPKRPVFLLRPGEFRDAFPGLIVERLEELDPEAGPVTTRLLARRPL